MYEFKVSDLADEFGVHRNTIRNWIAAGTLPAKKAPGRKYSIRWNDYQALCQKFGRQPTVWPEDDAEAVVESPRERHKGGPPPLELKFEEKTLCDDPSWADQCSTCGSCSGACPISGVDGLDPRKVVRMAALGLEEELMASDWMWKCTMCAKCEQACPAEVKIVRLIIRLRSRYDREAIPGSIHHGVTTCLEYGNNLGVPKEDFLKLTDELGHELATESCPGFTTPVDQRGARLLLTVNSKELFAEPDNLKIWWKILHMAGESWTLASDNWEGVNWGFFSGDSDAMKTIVGRLVDNARSLNCQALLLPE